jgi:hypothetical protein
MVRENTFSIARLLSSCHRISLFLETFSKDDDPILPIYKIIEELGGWPLKKNNDSPKDGNYLIPLVRKARQMGFDTMATIQVLVGPYMKNTSRHILVV